MSRTKLLVPFTFIIVTGFWWLSRKPMNISIIAALAGWLLADALWSIGRSLRRLYIHKKSGG